MRKSLVCSLALMVNLACFTVRANDFRSVCDTQTKRCVANDVLPVVKLGRAFTGEKYRFSFRDSQSNTVYSLDIVARYINSRFEMRATGSFGFSETIPMTIERNGNVLFAGNVEIPTPTLQGLFNLINTVMASDSNGSPTVVEFVLTANFDGSVDLNEIRTNLDTSVLRNLD